MNPATFTVHVQIMSADQELPTPHDWKSWLPCTSIRETVAMAAQKHVRERGGVPDGETYAFKVAAYTDAMISDTGRCANGNPRTCIVTTFTATKDPTAREALVA